MTDTDTDLKEIFEGEKMIYILHGDTNRIDQLIKDYHRDYENVADYPFDASDSNSEHHVMDLTLRQLMCNAFVVHTDRLDDLNGSRIKEFVHGEIHEHALQYLVFACHSKSVRKLIIVTTSNPHSSMFNRDSGLRARSTFIEIG